MDVSGIIVNYKSKDLTKNAINSILENTEGLEYEIFVVDNWSDLTSENLVGFCTYARRKFYLRSRYLVYKVFQSLRNLDEMKRNLKAFGRLLRFMR